MKALKELTGEHYHNPVCSTPNLDVDPGTWTKDLPHAMWKATQPCS